MWIKSCNGKRLNLNHVDTIYVESGDTYRVIAVINRPYDPGDWVPTTDLFVGTKEECEIYLRHLDIYLGVVAVEMILTPRNRATPK